MRKDYLIPLAILVGFILHAFIMTTFEKPTAGQACVEHMKTTKEYKSKKREFDKGQYLLMFCGQSGN